MPKGPSVRNVISLIKIWMMVPNAKVTIARYGPVTRNAGNASKAPNAAVMAMLAGMMTHNGAPSLRKSTPAV